MRFQYKCALQTLIGLFPNAESLNYLLQKYLSRSMPPSRENLESQRKQAATYHGIYDKHRTKPIRDSVVYEIGCGWTLAIPLALGAFGYKEIICTDLHMHVRRELVDLVSRYLRDTGMTGFSGGMEEFLHEYNIRLLAPYDSAKTEFQDNQIDFIFSNAVFEHIPEALLHPILKECRRVLDGGGVASFHIDYQDHYANFDKTITPYNFLKYSDAEWRKYNPRLHYVNRLRHSDYVRIFQSADLEIIEEETFRPGNWEEMMQGLRFAEDFSSRYSTRDLSITGGRFTVRKAGRAGRPCKP